MKYVLRTTLVAVIMHCAAHLAAVHAQVDPFSRVEIFGGGAMNVGDSQIHEYWQPGYGGEVSFSTPFYLGDAELGGAFHRYETTGGGVPRFDALLVYAGWGIALRPIHAISWYNGFRVGNNRMTFDEETFPGVKNESEFMLGAQTRLTVRLFKQTGIFAAAHFAQTYTYIRIRTVYVSAGLTTSFATPLWLQSFLR